MLQRAAAMVVARYRQREVVGACTESLGSETGDVGGDPEIDQLPAAAVVFAGEDEEEEEEVAGAETQYSLEKRRRTERLLPPAMPRASEAFMRAERRGGRLILTEVVRPADRPREVFRASRAGGRLLLRFADDDASPVPGGSETKKESDAEIEKGIMAAGGCCNCNGAVGFCHATAGGAGRRVEVGAVMGI